MFTSCLAIAQDQQVNVEPPQLIYPRVTCLEYFIRVPDWIKLVAGLSEKSSIGPFDYSFARDEAMFLPALRFATVEEARAVLDPMLEAWRIQTIITQNYSMSFRYMAHELAMQPPQPGAAPITRRSRPSAPTNFRVSADIDRYPPPPSHWGMDECTRDLVAHYEESSNDRTLLMHAYAMVTRVEYEHRSLPGAAKKLAVSLNVLKWIKTMASERTLGGRARKYTRKSPPLEPLAADELEALNWIIRELVNRSAKLASNVSPGKTIRLTPGGSLAERVQRERLRHRPTKRV
jgi:hypothetical protein